MPVHLPSFAKAADRAVAAAQPVPRGLTFRARSGHEADAKTAVANALPGWVLAPVTMLPGRYEAFPLDRDPNSLSLATVWAAVRTVGSLPPVESAEPILLIATPQPKSPAAAEGFALGIRQHQFGLWGLPYPQPIQQQINRFAKVSSPGTGPCTENPHARDWHLHQLHVCAAWQRWREKHSGLPGAGITIGHPDTGYSDHHELQGVWALPGRSFVEFDDERDARDDLRVWHEEFLETPGHGTATACVIASGQTNAAPGEPEAYGVAPGARVLPLRVSRSVLHLDFGNLARAITYAAEQGVAVISMSLGGPWYSDWVRESIRFALDRGVIVVAAAGNYLPATAFPAGLPEVVGVAATNVAETAWRFSGIGRLVDIAAPGEAVWRARAASTKTGAVFSVTPGTGTSFATACIAGVAALWVSYFDGRDAIAAHYGGDLSLVPFAFQCHLTRTARSRSDSDRSKTLELVRDGGYGPGIADADALLATPLPSPEDVTAFKETITGQRVNKLTFLAGLFTGGRALAPSGENASGAEADQAGETAANAADDFLRDTPAGVRDEFYALAAADLTLLAALTRWRSGESRLPLLDRVLEPQSFGETAPVIDLSADLRNALQDLRQREKRQLPLVHRGALVPGVSLTLPERHPEAAAILPAEPAYRLLHAYSFDPSLETILDTAPVHRVTIPARWENVAPGPIGEYLEVIDVDPASGCVYSPVDLNHPHILAQDGLPPSEGSPQFHQQMVYAVAMNTISRFELALGRPVFWSPLRPWSDDYPEERWHFTPEAAAMQSRRGKGKRSRAAQLRDELQTRYVQRLRIYPHALREANAYYSPAKRSLLFGYFPSEGDTGRDYPGGTIFTCLSHDIIAHEITHALVDGMHPHFNEPSNDDVWAFHEAFADIMALFQHFTYPEVLRHQIANTRGDLETENLLGQLAQQFGQATGQRGALRNYLGKPNEQGVWERTKPNPHALDTTSESHERGSILVAAVFDAFLALYRDRVSDLLRISTGGTGILPAGQIHPDLANRLATEAAQVADEVLRICIRAMDYLPPVDVTFGEFLRALITADYDLSPTVRRKNRVAFIEAFRAWGIYPRDVGTLSEESLRWRGADPDSRLAQAIKNLRQSDRRTRSIISGLVEALEGWQPGTCRDEVFARILAAQAGFHQLLRGIQPDDEKTPDFISGLDLRRGARFSVGNLRPARRIGPLGEFRTEMVVEVVQTSRPGHGEDQGIPLRGGATLIVDLNSWDIRYVVSKSLYRRLPDPAGEYDEDALTDRLRRRMSAEGERPVWKGELAANRAGRLAATYSTAESRRALRNEPFALLHRGF